MYEMKCSTLFTEKVFQFVAGKRWKKKKKEKKSKVVEEKTNKQKTNN